jgi:hypothetical protein
MMQRGENSCPYRDSSSDPSVVQTVASLYTDCCPQHSLPECYLTCDRSNLKSCSSKNRYEIPCQEGRNKILLVPKTQISSYSCCPVFLVCTSFSNLVVWKANSSGVCPCVQPSLPSQQINNSYGMSVCNTMLANPRSVAQFILFVVISIEHMAMLLVFCCAEHNVMKGSRDTYA